MLLIIDTGRRICSGNRRRRCTVTFVEVRNSCRWPHFCASRNEVRTWVGRPGGVIVVLHEGRGIIPARFGTQEVSRPQHQHFAGEASTPSRCWRSRLQMQLDQEADGTVSRAHMKMSRAPPASDSTRARRQSQRASRRRSSADSCTHQLSVKTQSERFTAMMRCANPTALCCDCFAPSVLPGILQVCL